VLEKFAAAGESLKSVNLLEREMIGSLTTKKLFLNI
jgi:hypothetical protein